MLGETLVDEQAVEAAGGVTKTLGLLPLETVFVPEKQTVQVSGQLSSGEQVTGYEIHLGRTKATRLIKPFVQLHDGRTDGVRSDDDRVIGTYLHGIFHNRQFTRNYFNNIRLEMGLTVIEGQVQAEEERREQAYEMLDRHVRQHLNMELIYSFIT